jgi:hypothetical protein
MFQWPEYSLIKQMENAGAILAKDHNFHVP